MTKTNANAKTMTIDIDRALEIITDNLGAKLTEHKEESEKITDKDLRDYLSRLAKIDHNEYHKSTRKHYLRWADTDSQKCKEQYTRCLTANKANAWQSETSQSCQTKQHPVDCEKERNAKQQKYFDSIAKEMGSNDPTTISVYDVNNRFLDSHFSYLSATRLVNPIGRLHHDIIVLLKGVLMSITTKT